MPLMEWKPALSVQVAAMDRQHQKLVELVNMLHDAMKQGKSKDVMGKILDDLLEYTRSHFSDEEKLMAAHNYPGLVAHRAQHAALTQQVSELQSRFREGTAVMSVDVLQFLNNWLTNHIQKEDKKYGELIGSQGGR